MAESVRVETLEAIRTKIDQAYHARDDYPPFKPMSFEDRPTYHHYIVKLIQEEIDHEKGATK